MSRPIRDAFESVLKTAGLTNICPKCGGLSESSSAVLVLNYGDEPATCSLCGLYLDPTGKPVGWRDQDGMVVVRVIALRDGYPADAAPIPVE